eukprot:NODE_479_length_6970_cov_0.750982.p5 type:complete len:181 gc:universal NODE_479_length_6970_cov_0.750982:6417-6959(+)
MVTRVFGYGSLIYKLDIPVIKQEIVYIKGWSRRFFQGSTDHRGTKEQPGRVCTILPDENEICWGIVFTLDPIYEQESIDKLDFRERNGYSIEALDVYTQDHSLLYSNVLTYVAKPDNEVYLGEAPIYEMAQTIVQCKGMSGNNSCYVLNLAKAVRELMPHVNDEHLFGLEKAILEIMQFQ